MQARSAEYSMKQIHATLVGLATTLALAGACTGSVPRHAEVASAANHDAVEADLAITRVNVVDVTAGRLLPDQTVLIAGGRIVSVMPAGEVEVPAGVRVVDTGGGYLMPGLVDTHVHLESGGGRGGPNEAANAERVLEQLLYYGVTTVLVFSGVPTDEIIRLRGMQRSGHLLAPHIHTTGGIITVPGSHPVTTVALQLPPGDDAASYWSRRGVRIVSTPSEMRQTVADLALAGVDGIKIVVERWAGSVGGAPNPRMSLDLVVAAVAEAKVHGIPVYAHATTAPEAHDAVLVGVRAIVHLVEEPDVSLLPTMRDNNVFYGPTLALWASWGPAWNDSTRLADPFLLAGIDAVVIRNALDSPEGREAMQSPAIAEDRTWWTASLAALKAACDAGVRIVLGTDSGVPMVFPGYSAHLELELLVEAGLTPAEALAAATRNGATMLGQHDVFGTIQTGMRADLLILDANPLDDIRNTRTIRAIVMNGRYLDRKALDALVSSAR
jgi:imidazolonepropionase-like amidohydrolase